MGVTVPRGRQEGEQGHNPRCDSCHHQVPGPTQNKSGITAGTRTPGPTEWRTRRHTCIPQPSCSILLSESWHLPSESSILLSVSIPRTETCSRHPRSDSRTNPHRHRYALGKRKSKGDVVSYQQSKSLGAKDSGTSNSPCLDMNNSGGGVQRCPALRRPRPGRVLGAGSVVSVRTVTGASSTPEGQGRTAHRPTSFLWDRIQEEES